MSLTKSIPLMLAAAALASGQVAATAPNGQLLSGRTGAAPPQPVSFDCAADGSVVNSLTGEPIPRTHVTLNSGGTTATAVADSTGKWSLANVACGTAPLSVTRPGFLQQTRRALTLVSGSPIHDVKMELIPQSVFYGRVLDDQGDPVMGVQVAVLTARILDGQIRFQPAQQANTNDLGEYRVANLPRGKYIVCASVQGGPARVEGLTFAEACYPGPVEGGTASAMEVPAGRENKVDFGLRQAVTVHVRGTVSGIPEGRGVGINLVKRGGAGAAPGGTVSGAVRDGKFDFRVPAGSYMLTADYFEAGKHVMARVPIDVATSDIDNVAVTLVGGFTVTGVVRIESQSEKPSSRQFGMSLRNSEPVGAAGGLEWSADHASFTFNDMVPGSYRLDLFPPPPFYVKSATLAGQDVLSGEFPLSQAAGPIEIVLRDDGGSIEGDVVNADGQPAAGGVQAIRNGKSVAAPPNRHFKLQNLAPGDYKVYAWDDPAQAAYADADWMRRYGGNGVSVTVSAGQNSLVKLTEQAVGQ